mmetsp:Transcript_38908/g.74539  ORF Transcript_38908/g.74539 Transcript_38908/m.74539 type:complete len:216 (+) Transcript_38908:893-1540(+)
MSPRSPCQTLAGSTFTLAARAAILSCAHLTMENSNNNTASTLAVPTDTENVVRSDAETVSSGGGIGGGDGGERTGGGEGGGAGNNGDRGGKGGDGGGGEGLGGGEGGGEGGRGDGGGRRGGRGLRGGEGGANTGGRGASGYGGGGRGGGGKGGGGGAHVGSVATSNATLAATSGRSPHKPVPSTRKMTPSPPLRPTAANSCGSVSVRAFSDTSRR